MREHKVGDKVRIRKDLNKHMQNVVSDMEDYADKEFKICKVAESTNGDGDHSYSLDGIGWYWRTEMFAGGTLLDIVLKELDIEMHEEFQIQGKSSNYKFGESSLKCDHSIYNWIPANETILYELLIGKLEVRKLPWKPKVGEIFYTPNLAENSSHRSSWYGVLVDVEAFENGIVCKTSKKATEIAKKINKSLKEIL